ncbi:MAG TPA: peptidoglycan DD-metalloendopeptidase family protein [Nocardioidaceae bacterium]
MFAAFPALARTPRRSLVAVVVALSAALSLLVAPGAPAPADELDNRRQKVHRKLERAAEDLRHSSKAFVRATKRVAETEKRLAAAEAVLDQRRTELVAAELLDARMQSELAAANARLRRARQAYARGQRSHAAQEQVLRQIAAQTYQGGSPGLMGLTLVLTSREPTELSTQLNVVENVMAKESATLSRLEASRLLLDLQRERVGEARRDVAARSRAAAESLERTQALEAEAATASAQVEKALQARETARTQALRTKRADERRLRQLRKERDTITQLIRKQQAQERKRKSKAAIARAKRASKARKGPMMRPIDSYITSPYGMRLHPIYRAWRLHDGTDFGAACGRPVRAAASGRVIGRYFNVGYGKRVIINHGYLRGHAVTTTYNHLSRYSAYVGQRVRRGEIIGFVGTTGYSTGCHLHFMVFRNGRTVNPMNWLP